ncbi:hypothetical protein PoB_006501000 [Plakobranchus ocellatus]|uniref:Uncharacterized protein n=1 Tax=Plakobranchus ocellatus TaxID=259542 RepID=A0AAV4D3F7_9GAST|nr:hypothetical protein PoB_006501000 [Plakobranchus ocellatus]
MPLKRIDINAVVRLTPALRCLPPVSPIPLPLAPAPGCPRCGQSNIPRPVFEDLERDVLVSFVVSAHDDLAETALPYNVQDLKSVEQMVVDHLTQPHTHTDNHTRSHTEGGEDE